MKLFNYYFLILLLFFPLNKYAILEDDLVQLVDGLQNVSKLLPTTGSKSIVTPEEQEKVKEEQEKIKEELSEIKKEIDEEAKTFSQNGSKPLATSEEQEEAAIELLDLKQKIVNKAKAFVDDASFANYRNFVQAVNDYINQLRDKKNKNKLDKSDVESFEVYKAQKIKDKYAYAAVVLELFNENLKEALKDPNIFIPKGVAFFKIITKDKQPDQILGEIIFRLNLLLRNAKEDEKFRKEVFPLLMPHLNGLSSLVEKDTTFVNLKTDKTYKEFKNLIKEIEGKGV